MRRQLRLLRYARPHWRSLLLICLAMAATVGLALLQPWPTKFVVDQVLGTHHLSGWLRAVADPRAR